MNIAKNIELIKKSIPKGVTLVAVSKTKPNQMILDAYQTGQRHFGENKVQDLVQKHESLPKDIKWHFIGHLQTNKVKYIAPFVHLIHAVDSIKLIKEINKQAKKTDRVIDVLIQFHIAKETSKFGINKENMYSFFDDLLDIDLQNVRIIGVMGMATFTNDEQQIRNEFKILKQFFNDLKDSYFKNSPFFKELSMGMSSDYQIAIKEGSTIVRIGSSIFGVR